MIYMVVVVVVGLIVVMVGSLQQRYDVVVGHIIVAVGLFIVAFTGLSLLRAQSSLVECAVISALLIGCYVFGAGIWSRKGSFVVVGLVLVAGSGFVWPSGTSPAIEVVDMVSVPVLTRAVVVDEVISQDIIVHRRIPLTALPQAVILTDKELANHLAVQTVYPDRPIQKSQIVEYIEVPVPKQFIPLGAKLQAGDFVTRNVSVSSITTDTLTILGDMDDVVPSVHLPPNQPVLKSSLRVRQELTTVYIAKSTLSPYHIVSEEDVLAQSLALSALQPTAGVNPIGKILVAAKQVGDVFVESDVITSDQQIQRVVVVTTDRRGALNGKLQPGDYVDVFTTPKQKSDQRTSTLLVDSALVLSSEQLGEVYHVTLGVTNDNATLVIRETPNVDFSLVLYPESRSNR